jgi:hypothetical protein
MSQVANTRMLYECLVPNRRGTVISVDPLCEGQVTEHLATFTKIKVQIATQRHTIAAM